MIVQILTKRLYNSGLESMKMMTRNVQEPIAGPSTQYAEVDNDKLEPTSTVACSEALKNR